MPMGKSFQFSAERLEYGFARLRLEASERFLRPGGSISGPTLFTLADLSLWAAVLTCIGPEPMAVTADMTIHFLRRPRLKPLICEAKVLKQGRKLIHGDILIWLEGEEAPVCHASGSYAAP